MFSTKRCTQINNRIQISWSAATLSQGNVCPYVGHSVMTVHCNFSSISVKQLNYNIVITKNIQSTFLGLVLGFPVLNNTELICETCEYQI